MPAIEFCLFKIISLLRKLPVNILGFGITSTFFSLFFKNFDKLEAVKGIFGDKTKDVLDNLKVEFTWVSGYMYVDGSDGRLIISKNYLNNGNKTDIYLDLIHELCHVKQFMDGRELFDPKYNYVDRPTEIEAYSYVVKEARRLGLSQERICEYLKVEWLSEEDHQKLLKSVSISCPKTCEKFQKFGSGKRILD